MTLSPGLLAHLRLRAKVRERLGLRKRSWQERMESELWEHGITTGRVWLVLIASGLLVALALAVAVGGI